MSFPLLSIPEEVEEDEAQRNEREDKLTIDAARRLLRFYRSVRVCECVCADSLEEEERVAKVWSELGGGGKEGEGKKGRVEALKEGAFSSSLQSCR